MMIPTHAGRVLISLFPSTILLGVYFAFIEMLAASHQIYWTGEGATSWAEMGFATLVYASYLMVVSGGLLAIITAPKRFRSAQTLFAPFALLVAALALWFVARNELPNAESALWSLIPVGFIAALSVQWFLAVRNAEYRGAHVQTAMLLALVSTTVALSLAGQKFAFEPLGPRHAREQALIWLAVVGSTALIWALIVRRLSIRPLAFALIMALIASLFPGWLLVERLKPRLATPHEKPNVLVVTIDTLRADACTAFGGVTPTPAMEALAQRGVLFETCYSLSPWTIPSMNGLFTSRFPPGLSPNAPAEQRQREGLSYGKLTSYWQDADGLTFIDRITKDYQTVAINGNPTLDSQRWLLDRFDRYLLVDALNEQQPKHLQSIPLLRRTLARWWPALNDTRHVDTTARITEYATSFLQTQTREPFFLWVHYMDPHGPYSPPNRFRRTSTPWTSFPPTKSFAAKVAAELPERDRSAARTLYNGEVEYVDACFGRIHDALRKANGLDSTIVMLSADHGESLWDHMGWGHAYDLYDEQVHIPLIFAGPGIRTERISNPVSAIDVLPTLAALMGVESEPEWHGRSLAGTLAPDFVELHPTPVYAQATSFAPYNPEPRQMVVDQNWKLIRGIETGDQRLFDRIADPQERNNLADLRPEVVQRLNVLLDQWHSSFPSSFVHFPQIHPENAEEDFVEKMRALGYIAE